jgi:hypothetical protein
VHEVEVEVVGAEVLEGDVEALLDAVVVRAPKLGGEEELLAGDAGRLDALADLLLVLGSAELIRGNQLSKGRHTNSPGSTARRQCGGTRS